MLIQAEKRSRTQPTISTESYERYLRLGHQERSHAFIAFMRTIIRPLRIALRLLKGRSTPSCSSPC